MASIQLPLCNTASLSKQLARSESDTLPAIHGRTYVEVKAQVAGILGRKS